MAEHISKKRQKNMILIFIVITMYSFLLCIENGMQPDRLVCVMFLDFLFIALLMFLLENQRLAGKLFKNRTTDYHHMLYGVIAASVLGSVCAFLPAFTRPVLAITIIITAFSSEWLGMCLGIYYSVVLAVTCGMSINELICYLILSLSSSMLFTVWENPALKKNFLLITVCLQTLVPTLFYYLEFEIYELHIQLISLLSGVVLSGILWFLYEKLYDLREHEIDTIMQDMLKEEYSVLKELRNFSIEEYEHAGKVSGIARNIAQAVGADETLCAVAGLYYRIGVMLGDQIAENGDRIAAEQCFPEKVCAILHEYYGVLQLPSNLESAIVQMADGVLCRIEEMRAKDEVNDWNKDMAIFHCLTEFSNNGMYENANLSVHKFLDIREYLVKEKLLYESVN